jgi:putative colanic acid biosynthesis acetyltransferase WcaF
MDSVDLASFDNSWYMTGRPLATRAAWHCANVLLLQNPLSVWSALKVGLLQAFGARVGRGVKLKPGINVKYPGNLCV